MEVEIDIEVGTRLVKIPVSVNNQGPFSFHFDTGASTTTLSKNLAERLGIPTYDGTRSNARGLGGGIPTQFAKATVSLGALSFDEEELYVIDLDKIMQGAGHRDGVLGYSTLKHCTLSLSYSRKIIRISRDGLRFSNSKSAIDWNYFKYIKDSHLIGVPVEINGQGPFDFILDTGAGNTVITPDLAQRIGLNAEPVMGIARGLGGDVELKMAFPDFLSVGDIRLDSPQIAVIDLTKVSPKGNLIENGIIGFDFLRSLETIIDYPQKRFSIIDERES